MPSAVRLPTNDEVLEWLWRWRFSSDGDTAPCRKCDRIRKHHRVRGRPAWQCDACGTHIHPTAGTLLERTRLPVAVWVRAVLALDAYPTLSARQLQTELRVSYKTAWRLRRLIVPRLPTEWLVGDEGTKAEAFHLLERVLSTDEADSRAGRALRRERRAGTRRSVLGSGSVRAREPREERILRATCLVLVRRGYAAARMAEIASEARVSLAALYAHFENREDLLLSAIDWANNKGTVQREEIIGRDCSATEKLAAFLNLAVPRGPVREEHALYLDLWSRVGGEAGLRPMVIRARERWHRYFREIIAEGVASGEFRPRARIDDCVAVIVALQTGVGVEAIVQFDWMSEKRARTLLASAVARELEIDPANLAS
jgi:AcrR family transcriptional regulator